MDPAVEVCTNEDNCFVVLCVITFSSDGSKRKSLHWAYEFVKIAMDLVGKDVQPPICVTIALGSPDETCLP